MYIVYGVYVRCVLRINSEKCECDRENELNGSKDKKWKPYNEMLRIVKRALHDSDVLQRSTSIDSVRITVMS